MTVGDWLYAARALLWYWRRGVPLSPRAVYRYLAVNLPAVRAWERE